MGRSPSPRMGRGLSPQLRQELENLDKDAASSKSAMRALKSYVKDLDSKAIPLFLAQVSETKQCSTSSGEHTISLYEVLARVHGSKIVPEIDNIMSTIVKTLSLSSGAFALHQACSKVVPAIARYAIDPTTAEDKKRYIIHSLCKPLSDCLLASQDNTSSGAALCLQALVESDNWRFSSSEMVNEVCQRVAGALEKHSQTNSQMSLVSALAKHNSLIVEAYARLLVRSGLQILDDGYSEVNSQKQLSAIHMLNSLMRCLDLKSISSELELVMKEMEKCQSDRMPFVARAAFETLQLAKKLCAENGAKTVRRMVNSGDQSPIFTTSPESHTVASSVGYNYGIESPNSICQGQHGLSYQRSVNRRLWRKFENGILDISLKDGIFSDITRGSDDLNAGFDENDCLNFTGFLQGDAESGSVRSRTPSPQRSNARSNIDDVKIFTTPRKLIHSLQDQENSNSACCNGHKNIRKFAWTPPASGHEQIAFSEDVDCQNGEHFHEKPESVSSTEENGRGLVMSKEAAPEVEFRKKGEDNYGYCSSRGSIAGCLCVAFLAATMMCLLAIGNEEDCCIPIPT
ncbi:protein SINE1-like [Andrographis paniculata]|uniref:protein SINE1-like n=1 Tax=Andrographis paniculata TaxID=175694 RepID=UPI0021E6F2F8|nr:protein SINE1-like [Andrographis paniculata]XP_051143941.1 protein SINE1-like [Andrographis paniculata]